VAEKERLYPKKDQIASGDVLIGLASSGLHSNGYSLVRKILFADNQKPLSEFVPDLHGTLADGLLTPTRIYVKPILSLLKQLPTAVHAMVHVTGGGFYDNIPRVLSPNLSAEISAITWEPPAIFPYLQALGNLSNEAMWHTFNCGIGFILVVEPSQAQQVLNTLKASGEEAHIIGQLIETPGLSEVYIQ
jgi:phosphoribosylformylglycinamidine cyclo-ligase